MLNTNPAGAERGWGGERWVRSWGGGGERELISTEIPGLLSPLNQ